MSRSALIGGGEASESRVHIVRRQWLVGDGWARLPSGGVVARPTVGSANDDGVRGGEPADYASEDAAGDLGTSM
jgi:hypothetical protein